MSENDDDGVSLTDSLDRHARYLDIDPIDDSGYLWIAREALDAELPSEWIEVDEEEGEFAGHLYYCNTATGESSWDHPLDEHYKEMFKDMKAKGEGDRRHRSYHPGERNCTTDDSNVIKEGKNMKQQKQNDLLTNNGNSSHHMREEESIDFIQDNAEYVDDVEEYRREEMIQSVEKTQKKNSILKSVHEEENNDSSSSFTEEEPEPPLQQQQQSIINGITTTTTHRKPSLGLSPLKEPKKKLMEDNVYIDFNAGSDKNTLMSSDVSDILREERIRRNEEDALAEKTEQMLVVRAERVERLLEEEQMKRKRLEKELYEECKSKAHEIEIAKEQFEKSHGQEKIAKQKLKEEEMKFKVELRKLIYQLDTVENEKVDIIKKHDLKITELLANAEIEKNELRQRVLSSENSVKTLREAKSQVEAKLECKDEELDARVRASLEEAEESYKSISESLKQKLLACQNQLELREKELACQIEEFDGLKAKRKKDFSNKTQEMTSAIKESENKVEQLRVELANSNVERSRLEAQCEAFHGDAKMNKDFSSKAQEEMTSAIKESENEVKQLRVELANSNVERSRLETQCEAFHGDAKMNKDFSNKAQEEMTSAIKESENEVKQLRVELANSNVERSRLEAQCEALHGEVQVQMSVNDTLKLKCLTITTNSAATNLQLQEAAHHEVSAHVNLKKTNVEESSTDRENMDAKDIVYERGRKRETERSTKAEEEAALASRNAECQILQNTADDEAHTKAQNVGADAKRNIAEQLMMIDKLKVEVENLRSKLSLSEEAQDQQQQQSSSSFNQESLVSGPPLHAHTTTQQQIPLVSSFTGRIPHQLTQGGGILTSATTEHAQMSLPQPPLPSSTTAQKLMLCLPPSTPFPRTPKPLIRNLNLPLKSQNQKPSAISVSPPQQVGQMVVESLYPAEKEVLQNNSSVLAALQERVNALQLQTRTFVQESLQALNTTQSNETSSSQLAENTNLVNWYRTQSELQDERISRLLMQATTKSPAGGTAESPFSSPRSTLAKHHLETGESPISRSLDTSSLSILSLPAEHPIANANGYGYRSGYWKNRYTSSLGP